MKRNAHFIVMALLAASMFILSGCPEDIEDDDPFNPALVGSWSNNLVKDAEYREFIIENDGSFSATLNPGGGGREELTGYSPGKGGMPT